LVFRLQKCEAIIDFKKPLSPSRPRRSNIDITADSEGKTNQNFNDHAASPNQLKN
jgi:hypothetical protein